MDDLTPAQSARKLWKDNLRSWRRRREGMTQCRAFLSGDRYENDYGPQNRDRRLNQIRGQETQDQIRHVVSVATQRPRSIEPRPVDPDFDPDQSEYAASLVEHETGNVWKDFDGCLEEAIQSAREQRLGVVMMDWDPECGPYGEILYRTVDGRRVMWDEAYNDPHHPMCGWFIEEFRIDVEKARKQYKAEWLMPDRVGVHADDVRRGVPLLRDADGWDTSNLEDNKVTLLRVWYKNDKTTAKKKREPEDGFTLWPPEKRYMSCDSGCGYRSPTEGELRTQGKLDFELPEMLEDSCPVCQEEGYSGDLIRIDGTQEEQEVLAYSKGKKLCVVAAQQQGPEDKPLYEGKWPIPSARSFPVFVITAYVKPGEPVGPCDVDLMWDQQVASDNLRTQAVQRVFEHRNYWEMPGAGMNDAHGNPFMFRDDQFNVMFRDPTLDQYQTPVRVHSGMGLDPQFMVAFNIVQAALTQYVTKLDLGPSEDHTRDIPVGSIERQVQQAELPTEHFIRRIQRNLSKFYGVLWDYIRATYTPARMARLRIGGQDMPVKLMGDDLPNYDFSVSESPAFTGLMKQRAEAFQTILQVATTMPPQMLEVFAEVNQLPRSIVRKVEEAMQEMRMQADMDMAMQMEAEMNGMAPPGPEGQEAPQQEIPSRAGMVPAGL